MAHWWDGFPEERYWCEVTDRADPGVALECPRADGSGHPWWSYDLVRSIRPGDVVFHFSPARGCVLGASLAAGPCAEAEVLWTAPPESLFDADGPGRVRVPGWSLPLRGFRAAAEPLTLERIRADLEREWHGNWWEMSRLPGYLPLHTLLFPRRPPSARGYILKIPAALVGYWPQLAALAASVDPACAAAGPSRAIGG